MAAPIQARRRATEDLRRVQGEMFAQVKKMGRQIANLERQLDFMARSIEAGADEPRPLRPKEAGNGS